MLFFCPHQTRVLSKQVSSMFCCVQFCLSLEDSVSAGFPCLEDALKHIIRGYLENEADYHQSGDTVSMFCFSHHCPQKAFTQIYFGFGSHACMAESGGDFYAHLSQGTKSPNLLLCQALQKHVAQQLKYLYNFDYKPDIVLVRNEFLP